MFANKSLKFRLITAFGVVASFLLIVAGINYRALVNTSAKYEHVTRQNFGNSISLGYLKKDSRTSFKNLVFIAFPGVSEKKNMELRNAIIQSIKHYELSDK